VALLPAREPSVGPGVDLAIARDGHRRHIVGGQSVGAGPAPGDLLREDADAKTGNASSPLTPGPSRRRLCRQRRRQTRDGEQKHEQRSSWITHLVLSRGIPNFLIAEQDPSISDPFDTSAFEFKERKVLVPDVPGCGLVLRVEMFKAKYQKTAWTVH
jgi:hypothetical protein